MATDLLDTKWEWMVTGDWNRLHYVPGYVNTDEWWDEATDGGIEGTSACGRRAVWSVPGVLSRLGRERCAHCCRALGIPRGDGCPQNDKALHIDGTGGGDA